MWRSIFILVLVLLAGMHGVSAQAAKRGFVVGISDYRFFPDRQLPRAVADAQGVSQALAAQGYEVTVDTRSLGRDAFYDLWSTFLETVRAGDEVTLYFSGHGIQIDRENYLLPANIRRFGSLQQTDARHHSIRIGGLLADLERRRPRVTVVIIDACRDNPFEERGRALGGAGGLAIERAPIGTLVLYAAGPSQVALEQLPGAPGSPSADTDRYSVFTRHLLPLIAQKGLEVREMAQRLREQVEHAAQSAGHAQRPAYEDNLSGRFCFAGCEAVAAPTLQQRSDPAPLQGGPAAPAEVVRVCREVESMTSLAMLAVLDRQHHGTPAGDCIGARIGELKAAETARAKAEAEARSRAEAAARMEEQRRLAALQSQQEDARRAAADTAPQQKAAQPAQQAPNAQAMVRLDAPRKLRMVSAYTQAQHATGIDPADVIQPLRQQTGDRLQIVSFGAGDLVPAAQVLDVVKNGASELGWGAAHFFSANDQSLAAIGGAVPFGLTADRHLAWLAGEGGPLRDKVYASHGVKAIACSLIAGNRGMWTRVPLRTGSDLRGMKLRGVGSLGSRSLRKLGVAVMQLPTADVIPALERGLVDGVIHVTPLGDESLGIHHHRKFYWTTPWFQEVSMIDLIVNREVWDSFPRQLQELFEQICRANLLQALTTERRGDRDALTRFRQMGVAVAPLPEPVIDALRKVADEVLAEEVARDPTFKRVLESYNRAR